MNKKWLWTMLRLYMISWNNYRIVASRQSGNKLLITPSKSGYCVELLLGCCRILLDLISQGFLIWLCRISNYNHLFNCRNFIFRSGIAGTCPTHEVQNLAFLDVAYAFSFRYNSADAVFQQVQKSKCSNGFVDNSIMFVMKTN